MNRLMSFLTRMDVRAARAVGVSIALFALVMAIFLIGRFVFDIEPGDIQLWLAEAASRWYALPLTILAFTVLSYVGAPQFALFAATVLAFGPVAGFAYSWAGTMVSAAANFWTGRLLGADVVRRILSNTPEESEGYRLFYNVNFPPVLADDVKGIRLATQGFRKGLGFSTEPHNAPSGRRFLWIKGGDQHRRTEPGSDAELNLQGYISVTPMRADLTAHDVLSDLEGINS